MPVTINGTTGITTPDLDSTADITANGVPFGKGGGSVLSNVAIGGSALAANTTGQFNVSLGRFAGISNTTGSRNTFVGDTCGYFTTGGSNTFIGTDSGYAVTTGTKNSILGPYSGNQNGLDIRASSNNIVLSDGDGAVRAAYVSGRASFALKTVNQGIVRVEGATEDSITVANGATLILTNTELGSAMVCVYDNGSGIGAVFFASYISGTSIMAQDSSGQFATSDSAGYLCVYKNAGTHTLTLKNNLGTSRSLTIAIYSAQAAFN